MSEQNYEIIWRPQSGPQTDLITCPVGEILFGGARGGGKPLAYGTRVATPSGWKNIEALIPGDRVISIDGQATDVLAVFDHENKKIYKLTFSDGGTARASGDHAWFCVGKFASRMTKTGHQHEGKKYTTLELKEKLESGQEALFPVPAPVNYTQRPRRLTTALHPYAFGVLLGDGSTASGGLLYGLLSSEQSLIKKMESFGFEHRVYVRKDGDGQDMRSMSAGILKKRSHPDAWEFANKVGGLMYRHSYDKYIPDHFLYGPIWERWELLRGLLDTDGGVDERGHIGIGTTSYKLAITVRHLVLSLGGLATVTGPHAKHAVSKKGERKLGRPVWSVYIHFDEPADAFFLERKRELARGVRYDGGKRQLSRRVVKIEEDGDGPCRCISVRHPSSLYIIDDFIVTHNTDAVIGKWVYHANQYGDKAHGVMFRRTFKQLEEVLKRTREIYPRIGARYSVTTQTWTFPNGATLKLRHLDNEIDAQAYQGHQYTYLVFEEATNWATSRPIDMLRATLRSAAGVPTQLILTANPGGPGHNWVKARYITPARNGYTLLRDSESTLDRVFIPSKLSDNKILVQNDPMYHERLKQTGPGALVKAWLEGNWDIVAGGFFDDVFSAERHLLQPFAIPTDWQIIVGFDWGFSAPASLGVFARVTSQNDQLAQKTGMNFPRGSLIRIKEWYTVAKDDQGYTRPGIGLKLTNEELGSGIARRLKTLPRPRVAAADPSIFAEQGGPSSYDRMQVGAKQEGYSLNFSKADNNRQSGWSRVRELLQNAAVEKPEREGLWIFNNCEEWLRTVPTLPADRLNMDDVDTDAEDHAADDTRYACMVRSRVPVMAKFFGG